MRRKAFSSLMCRERNNRETFRRYLELPEDQAQVEQALLKQYVALIQFFMQEHGIPSEKRLLVPYPVQELFQNHFQLSFPAELSMGKFLEITAHLSLSPHAGGLEEKTAGQSIDLAPTAGLPIRLNPTSWRLEFGDKLPPVAPAVRRIESLKEVAKDQAGLTNDVGEAAYWMYRNIHTPSDSSAAAAHQLRYDVTILAPSDEKHRLGEELVKTYGHYHPPGHPLPYPEVYEVLYGEAWFLLQRFALGNPGRIEAVFLVRAKAGEKVIMLPGYGHVTINPSQTEPLVMANWVSSAFDSQYEKYRQYRGAAYYVTWSESKGEEFRPNRAYESVPKIRQMRPASELPEFGLKAGEPMYPLIQQPQRLAFLNEPEQFTRIFAQALVPLTSLEQLEVLSEPLRKAGMTSLHWSPTVLEDPALWRQAVRHIPRLLRESPQVFIPVVEGTHAVQVGWGLELHPAGVKAATTQLGAAEANLTETQPYEVYSGFVEYVRQRARGVGANTLWLNERGVFYQIPGTTHRTLLEGVFLPEGLWEFLQDRRLTLALAVSVEDQVGWESIRWLLDPRTLRHNIPFEEGAGSIPLPIPMRGPNGRRLGPLQGYVEAVTRDSETGSIIPTSFIVKSTAGLEELDEPQLRQNNAYAKSMQALLNWPGFTSESTQRLLALKQAGPAIEQNIQHFLDNDRIQIALVPLGSTLKGYAAADSDVDYAILILNGLDAKRSYLDSRQTGQIYGDAAYYLRGFGFRSDVAMPEALSEVFDLAYLRNYSTLTHPNPSWKDWHSPGPSMTNELADLSALFLPIAYGDPILIEQARKNVISRFFTEQKQNRWGFVETMHRSFVTIPENENSQKEHLLTWISQRRSPALSVQDFKRERDSKVQLPSLEEMGRIYFGFSSPPTWTGLEEGNLRRLLIVGGSQESIHSLTAAVKAVRPELQVMTAQLPDQLDETLATLRDPARAPDAAMGTADSSVLSERMRPVMEELDMSGKPSSFPPAPYEAGTIRAVLDKLDAQIHRTAGLEEASQVKDQIRQLNRSSMKLARAWKGYLMSPTIEDLTGSFYEPTAPFIDPRRAIRPKQVEEFLTENPNGILQISPDSNTFYLMKLGENPGAAYLAKQAEALRTLAAQTTWGDRERSTQWRILDGAAGLKLLEELAQKDPTLEIADLRGVYWREGKVPLVSVTTNLIRVWPDRHFVAIAPSGDVAIIPKDELVEQGGPKAKAWLEALASWVEPSVHPVHRQLVGLVSPTTAGLEEESSRGEKYVVVGSLDGGQDTFFFEFHKREYPLGKLPAKAGDIFLIKTMFTPKLISRLHGFEYMLRVMEDGTLALLLESRTAQHLKKDMAGFKVRPGILRKEEIEIVGDWNAASRKKSSVDVETPEDKMEVSFDGTSLVFDYRAPRTQKYPFPSFVVFKLRPVSGRERIESAVEKVLGGKRVEDLRPSEILEVISRLMGRRPNALFSLATIFPIEVDTNGTAWLLFLDGTWMRRTDFNPDAKTIIQMVERFSAGISASSDLGYTWRVDDAGGRVYWTLSGVPSENFETYLGENLFQDRYRPVPGLEYSFAIHWQKDLEQFRVEKSAVKRPPLPAAGLEEGIGVVRNFVASVLEEAPYGTVPTVIGYQLQRERPYLSKIFAGLEEKNIFLGKESIPDTLAELIAKKDAQVAIYVGLEEEGKHFAKLAPKAGIDPVIRPIEKGSEGTFRVVMEILMQASGLEEDAIRARTGFREFMAGLEEITSGA